MTMEITTTMDIMMVAITTAAKTAKPPHADNQTPAGMFCRRFVCAIGGRFVTIQNGCDIGEFGGVDDFVTAKAPSFNKIQYEFNNRAADVSTRIT